MFFRGEGLAAEEVEKPDHVVATLFTGQDLRSRFDDGHSVGVVARAVDMAVFDEKVHTAHAENVAGGVEDTVVDAHISDVDTCDTVVTRAENASVYEDIRAAMEVDAVTCAKVCDLFHHNVVALVKLMHEVATMLYCVTF